jgi:hypothetical protein
MSEPIMCKCGQPMRYSEAFGQFYCADSPVDVEDDRHTGQIDEAFTAAHRMGPFAGRQANDRAPYDLPGFAWTGELFERIASAPPRRELPWSAPRPIPWLRIALWTGLGLLLLRLL